MGKIEIIIGIIFVISLVRAAQAESYFNGIIFGKNIIKEKYEDLKEDIDFEYNEAKKKYEDNMNFLKIITFLSVLYFILKEFVF